MNKIGFETWGIGCSLAIAWALGACSSSSPANTTAATGGSIAAGAQTGVGAAGPGTGGTSFGGTGGLGVGATGTTTGGTTGAQGTTTGGTTGTTTGGTTSTTTGGTTGTTTGGTAGSSTDVTTGPITGFNVDEGGYIQFCGMKGYSWTAAGPETANNDTGSLSSVAPADFSTLAAGTSLCATGSVAEDADYAGYAMVGINIGQEAGEETPNVNVTPTGTGLVVNVTNNTSTALRVQIQDDLGADDPDHRWCADVPKSGSGTIPWTDFNTMCWKPADGIAYAMEPLDAVMIIVPGSNSADRSFDFCLNGFTVEGVDCPVIAGSDGGATGTAGSAGDTGGAGTGEPGGAGGVAEAGGAPGTGGDLPATGGTAGAGGDPGTGGA